jgi:UDP-3-O-[3-hydroxymyristoyl] glucosamine N-acyltransferase
VTGAEIAALLGGRFVGEEVEVRGVAPLEGAGPGQVAFAEGRVPEGCAAGLLLARAPVEGRPTVVLDDPKRGFLALLRAWFPEVEGFWPVRGEDGAPEPLPAGAQRGAVVHPGAFVHPSAQLGEGAVVHPGAYVGAGCAVGAGTVVYPHAVLYPGTVVGRGCRIHAGAVLGADGFGFHPGARGPEKVPQVGRVVLGDEVEVGANSTVDRAFLSTTRLGDRTKLDNLVQIGHNCQVGRGVVFAGQAGLSGSVTVGDGVQVGGQVGIADHAAVGAGALLAAQSGIHGRVAAGEAVFGSPAMPMRQARRVFALLRRLPALFAEVEALRRAARPQGPEEP